MKDFMEEELWLASWHFFNFGTEQEGGQLKITLYVC